MLPEPVWGGLRPSIIKKCTNAELQLMNTKKKLIPSMKPNESSVGHSGIFFHAKLADFHFKNVFFFSANTFCMVFNVSLSNTVLKLQHTQQLAELSQ